jgi:transcriptional regulator with XRE-family HTH domain
MATTPTVGAEIRAIRRARGLTQAQVAEALEVPQASISRLESGATRPRWEVVARVLALLEVTPGEWERLRP